MLEVLEQILEQVEAVAIKVDRMDGRLHVVEKNLGYLHSAVEHVEKCIADCFNC